MKTYTEEDVIAKINEMEPAELRRKSIKVIRKHMPKHICEDIHGIFMEGISPVAQISEDRSIATREVKELHHSPMMEYADKIIEAALRPEGPFQTRELMLVVGALCDEPPFFMKGGIMSKKHKTQVGYILSMAGFERRSHFDKETKKPVKAWKSKAGLQWMSVTDRMSMVRSTINHVLMPTDQPQTLEDLV